MPSALQVLAVHLELYEKMESPQTSVRVLCKYSPNCQTETFSPGWRKEAYKTQRAKERYGIQEVRKTHKVQKAPETHKIHGFNSRSNCCRRLQLTTLQEVVQAAAGKQLL